MQSDGEQGVGVVTVFSSLHGTPCTWTLFPARHTVHARMAYLTGRAVSVTAQPLPTSPTPSTYEPYQIERVAEPCTNAYPKQSDVIPRTDRCAQVPLSAGDLIIGDARLLHSAWGNTTETRRCGSLPSL